jgi:small-conductance mechanosensitive channel
MEFLEKIYWNNTVLDYIVFLGVLCWRSDHLSARTHRARRIVSYTERTQSPYGELVRAGVKHYLLPMAYFTLFYYCTRTLKLNTTLDNFVGALSTLFAIIMASMFLSSIAVLFLSKLGKGKLDSNSLAMRWLIRIAKGVIWGIALILFLDNIGVKITSLVAGLGIGGVALAFAAQNVLTDIFCFFTIFFDKPFEIGDFIISGDHMVPSSISREDHAFARARRRAARRLQHGSDGLPHSQLQDHAAAAGSLFARGHVNTPNEKLKQIPQIIQKIIEETEDTTFARAHFASFGSYSLNFEVVYFVLTSDYDRYMDINQRVNLAIKEEFERLGVVFAFPTSVVQMQQGSSLYSQE